MRPSDADFATALRILGEAGLDDRPVAVSALGDGVKGRVLGLDFERRERLALKLYERPVAAREQAAYRAVGTNELGLPRLLAASDRPAPGAEHGWTLMELAPGRALNTQLATLDEADEYELFRELGAWMQRLHSLQQPAFGAFESAGPPFTGNAEWVRERFSQALVEFVQHGGDEELANAVERLLAERHDVLGSCTQAVFCHGDLHAENLRVELGGPRLKLVGALDLELAFAGDPVMDLALAWAARSPHDDAVYDALLDGYGDPPPWINAVLDVYVVLAELELWNFFATGGSREPLAEIAERIASAVHAHG